MNNRFNFTDKFLAVLPILADKKSVVYCDDGQPGLYVIATYGGTKTYYSYIKFQGVPKSGGLGQLNWLMHGPRRGN